MTDNAAKAAIGIDVGGTAIKGGVVSPDGQVLDKQSVATEADKGVDHVIGRLSDLIGRLRQTASSQSVEIEAVGLGMPGTLNHQQGIVLSPPNLEGWRNVPVVQRVNSVTGLRIVLDNDANNAALGEFLCGAGRGVRNMALLTLGTGIGGGIILDGRLWHGANGAGEFGHMIVHVGGRCCNCGQVGCLEAYASADSTVARAVEGIKAGEPSSLKSLLDRDAGIKAAQVVEAAFAGDALAKRVWDETCRYLAVGCINIHHALHVERIVLAGGMSGAGERLLAPVVQAMKEMASGMMGAPPDLRIAELGNDAGFVGSALSVFRANDH